MAHSHRYGQAGRGRPATARRLAWALGLAAAYAVAELLGGLLANSLALLADAGHMLSDAAALGLSLFAAWIARRPPSSRRTFGFYRAEILAATLNGATLIAIAVLIVVEALQRLRTPPEVEGGLMVAVAAGGLAVNLAMLAVLRGSREESLNVRGAWLHVLTDTLGSVQAIAAGAAVAVLGWRWADPVASLAIGVLIGYSALGLLREAVSVLMESVPGHIDLDRLREAMLAVPGVRGVHELHVWAITSGFVALSAHVVAAQPSGELLPALRRMLHERFGVEHATLQVERAETDCADAPRNGCAPCGG